MAHASPAATWPTFTSEDGGFKVRMPAEAVRECTKVETESGTMVRETVSCTSNKALYQVSYVDLPQDVFEGRTGDDILRLAQDGAKPDTKAMVFREGGGELAGRPFQRFRVEDSRGPYVFNEVLLDGHRLFHLIVVTPGTYFRRADPKGFFDSFALGSG